MLTQKELAKIATLCDNVGTSPWCVTTGHEPGEHVLLNADNHRIASSLPDVENMAHNPEEVLEFCAFARSVIPQLLAHIEAIEELRLDGGTAADEISKKELSP